MIADYVMKSIDSIFSGKLSTNNNQLMPSKILSNHNHNQNQNFNK